MFKIDDEEWTLDLRSGKGKVSKGGAGNDKPDLTLTISDDNFVKLVMGKMGPQQVNANDHVLGCSCITAIEFCGNKTIFMASVCLPPASIFAAVKASCNV